MRTLNHPKLMQQTRSKVLRRSLVPTFAYLLFGAFTSLAAKPDMSLVIQANKPGPKINPAMWGIFFEDINFGADGGLYAELVKNRSFEFPKPLMGWTPVDPNKGIVKISTATPFHNANPHYLELASDAAGSGVVNEGFRGIGIKRGETYDFSAQLRDLQGTASLRVELVSPDGLSLASARVKGISSQWKKVSAHLVSSATEPKARLRITLEQPGSVAIDMVSLFPRKTWKNRPNGLRADLVRLLADMKPGFVRFPGGCIVEGSHLDRRYQWKDTVGPVEQRELVINRWNYEFKHRPAPDYFQSFGLGFFEFFQLSEDIGAKPLPILNCGMACQFNSKELVPLDQLDPYIQDALDLIEFANGSVDTKWGGLRAAMGHPKPFGMQWLGIGNEQWGPQYIERYARFAEVLKAKHPEIVLISSAGPAPSDERFNFLWPKLRELKAEIVDEHCYANPSWFLANAGRYDTYDRSGPKVFMGEYAAQSVAIASPNNRNTLECALAEAAFMTGMERNADVVSLASYAPLMAHVDAWQWSPNMIWADNLRAYGTPNYYAQSLFCQNRGDQVLPVTLEVPAIPAAGRIAFGTYQTAVEFSDVRVVARDGSVLSKPDSITSWSREADTWTVQDGILRQADPRATSWIAAGDLSWSDYTLHLKARKIGGNEGFLIRVLDTGKSTSLTWNLGGWGNKFHGLQSVVGGQEELLAQEPGSIEQGRWYNVRVQLKEGRIACYLDDQLIQTAAIPAAKIQRLFATAARDLKTDEIILKVVNPTDQARAEINVQGVNRLASRARMIVLTSGNPADQNSLSEPRRVAPAESRIEIRNTRFEHDFAPHSMTVLRLKTR